MWNGLGFTDLNFVLEQLSQPHFVSHVDYQSIFKNTKIDTLFPVCQQNDGNLGE